MMNLDGNYKRFEDETPSTPEGTMGFPPPSYAPPTFEMDKQMVQNCRRTKRLAIVELALSCLILLFGMISTGLGANIEPYYAVVSCNMGTSIWAPVIGIITAGLGLGALKYGNYSRKCLLVSHFVMCVISAIVSGILMIFTSACLASMSWVLSSYTEVECTPYSTKPCEPWNPVAKRGLPEALVAFEVFILIGALAHIIASIVSTAFICRYWCGGKGNTGTTVLYIPNTHGSGNGSMQTITVPAGAKVVFVQSNAPIGQGPATLPVAP